MANIRQIFVKYKITIRIVNIFLYSHTRNIIFSKVSLE